MNPNAADTGRRDASIEIDCATNCEAVFFSTCPTCLATIVNIVLAAFSISIHFTSIHPYINGKNLIVSISNWRQEVHL
jgi:hypothetical protein